MKNYEEMSKNVLDRVNAYEAKRAENKKKTGKIIGSVGTVAFAALLGIGIWQSGLFTKTEPAISTGESKTVESNLKVQENDPIVTPDEKKDAKVDPVVTPDEQNAKTVDPVVNPNEKTPAKTGDVNDMAVNHFIGLIDLDGTFYVQVDDGADYTEGELIGNASEYGYYAVDGNYCDFDESVKVYRSVEDDCVLVVTLEDGEKLTFKFVNDGTDDFCQALDGRYFYEVIADGDTDILNDEPEGVDDVAYGHFIGSVDLDGTIYVQFADGANYTEGELIGKASEFGYYDVDGFVTYFDEDVKLYRSAEDAKVLITTLADGEKIAFRWVEMPC